LVQRTLGLLPSSFSELNPIAYVWHPDLFVTVVKVKRKKKKVGLGGKIGPTSFKNLWIRQF